jgi:hypothetical protein
LALAASQDALGAEGALPQPAAVAATDTISEIETARMPSLSAAGARRLAKRVDRAADTTVERVNRTEHARAIVLVEGVSDRIAVETLARRQGRDLATEGVSVVAIGGAQAIARELGALANTAVRLAGLCDAGEEADFRRALERAGLGSGLTRADMEALGFYVCERDLEDELIRALGPERVLDVADAEGDLTAFRTLQRQPEWRGRPVQDQLRRWMGSGGRRKLRYARLLVEALEPAEVPRPLRLVLARI